MSSYYDSEPNYNNYWTKAADEGDGQFAIAVALLEVAAAIRAVGSTDAVVYLADHLGEKLGYPLSEIANSLHSVASSIDYIPNALTEKGNGEGDRT